METLAATSLALAVAGFFLSRAWYHDDACTIEEWKCDAGGIGFALAPYAAVAAILLLAVLAAGRMIRAAAR